MSQQSLVRSLLKVYHEIIAAKTHKQLFAGVDQTWLKSFMQNVRKSLGCLISKYRLGASLKQFLLRAAYTLLPTKPKLLLTQKLSRHPLLVNLSLKNNSVTRLVALLEMLCITAAPQHQQNKTTLTTWWWLAKKMADESPGCSSCSVWYTVQLQPVYQESTRLLP